MRHNTIHGKGLCHTSPPVASWKTSSYLRTQSCRSLSSFLKDWGGRDCTAALRVARENHGQQLLVG